MTITYEGGIQISGGMLSLNQPILNLDFTTGTLDSCISFTRASPASYVNSNGLLQIALSGAPRFTHDPVSLRPLGLLIESSSINVVKQSADFTSTTWSKTSVAPVGKTLAPNGAVEADSINATVAGGLISQTLTFTGNSNKALSVFVKAGTASTSRINLRDSSLGISRLDATISWTAGIPSVTMTAGVYQGTDVFSNGWFRIKFTATDVVASSTNSLRIYPGGSSGTGTIGCWGVQAENNADTSSYIPTSTVAVQRFADGASISGSNFTSWFNNIDGTFVATSISPAVNTSVIMSVDNTTVNNTMSLLTNSINIGFNVVSSGSPQANISAGFALANRQLSVAASYTNNAFNAAANGGAAFTDISGTVPTVTRMLLGTDINGNYLNGTISSISYYDYIVDVTVLTGLIDTQNYGARWNISSSSSIIERAGGSIGLSSLTAIGTALPVGSNSFDSIYPWSNIRRCAISRLPGDTMQIIYEDEPGFATDGSAGDVMMEIPVFYYDRYQSGGYEYRWISAVGNTPHPAFVENGVVLPKVYISAFEGYISDNTMYSRSGVLPTTNMFPQDLLNTATTKGSGWSMMDSRMVDLIQNLLWIEYATRNSTNVIGHGISDLIQPRTNYFPISYAGTATNNWITNTSMTANDQERLWPGADVLICDTLQTNIVAKRKVVSVTVDSPTIGNTTVAVDGDPLNVTTSMFFGGAPQTTGQTDAMAYHTGRLDRPKTIPTSTISRDRLNCNKYRGIENPCGNMWHFLPDITFLHGAMYKSNDIADYEFGKTTGSYQFLTNSVPLQTGNTDGVDALWMTEMIIGGDLNEGVPFADTSVIAGSEFNYFGAAHYLNPDLNVVVHGGGFDHKDRTNIATMRAWPTLTDRWYLYGGRLMWKNV